MILSNHGKRHLPAAPTVLYIREVALKMIARSRRQFPGGDRCWTRWTNDVALAHGHSHPHRGEAARKGKTERE